MKRQFDPLHRRSLLSTTVLATSAAVLVTLGACQNGATPQTQLQTTAALVTAGVDAVGASVMATPNLDPAIIAKIKSDVQTVDDANKVIQATATVGTNAQALVTGVRLAASLLLATLNPTSPEAIALNAALSLLPTILMLAGVPLPQAMARMETMDPAQAVLVLKGYTGK